MRAMAHCFRCGTTIPADERQPRRRVQTGEWVRRDQRSSYGWTVKRRMGMRIVCRRCAGIIDRMEREDTRVWALKLSAAVVVLVVALAARLLGAFD